MAFNSRRGYAILYFTKESYDERMGEAGRVRR